MISFKSSCLSKFRGRGKDMRQFFVILGLVLASTLSSGQEIIHPKLPKTAKLPNGETVTVPNPSGWQVYEERFEVDRKGRIIYTDKTNPTDVILGRFLTLTPSESSPAIFDIFYPLNDRLPTLVRWNSTGQRGQTFAILFKKDGTFVASTGVLSGMGPDFNKDEELRICAYIFWQRERLAENCFDFPK